jgi:hypothetical protein
MSDIYKEILNQIAKPITALNDFQMSGVLRRLEAGTLEERLTAVSLRRLNNYVNLSIQVLLEERRKLDSFLESLDE